MNNFTIDELLQKRDWHKSLVHLHSGPYGMRTYRLYHEGEIEKIDRELKSRMIEPVDSTIKEEVKTEV